MIDGKHACELGWRTEGTSTMIRPGNVVRLLLTSAAFAGALCCGPTAGQAQGSRYHSPYSPTISPYLNLSRDQVSGLPNYFSLVRPQLWQQEVNRQAQATMQSQQHEITHLRDEFQRNVPPIAVTGTGSWFGVPGTQIRYLDSSGYYPQPAVRRPRR